MVSDSDSNSNRDKWLTVSPPSPKGRLEERRSREATTPLLLLPLLALLVVLPVEGVDATDEPADEVGAGVEELLRDKAAAKCGRATREDIGDRIYIKVRLAWSTDGKMIVGGRY